MLKCTLSNTTQELSSGYLSLIPISILVLLNSKTTPTKNLIQKKLQREQKSASTQGWTLTLFLAVSGFLLPPLPRMAEVGGVRGALICRRSGFFTSLFCLSHTTIIDPVSLHVLFFSVSNLNCVSISYTVFVVSTLPTLLLCLKVPVSLGKDVSRVGK